MSTYNLPTVSHLVKITVSDSLGKEITEVYKWDNLTFELRCKYDWYFKYRAALLQVKYPKKFIELIYNEQEETRICSKCGIEKPLIDFTKDKRKKLGIRGVCKKCSSKRLCDYSKTEKSKEARKKYHKTDSYLTYRKKYENENKDKLSDRYIVSNISRSCKLSRKEIREHPELIEINRIIIKTKRLCKTLKN